MLQIQSHATVENQISMPPKRSMSISGHNLQMHCFNISKPRLSIFKDIRRLQETLSQPYEILHNKRYTKDTSLSKYIWEIKVISQKGSCILQHYKKSVFYVFTKNWEVVNYPQPEELLNKHSELVSKCRHANKYLLNNYKANDEVLQHPSRIYAILTKYNFDVKTVFLKM